jgi:PAS domain S-box-containing protein
VHAIDALERISGEAANGDLRSNADFLSVFAATPGVNLLLAADAPRFTMLAASDDRLSATMSTREATIGKPLFDVFSDANPANLGGTGAANLLASLEAVIRTGVAQRMPTQRFDLQRPDGSWEERYWEPHNVPVPGEDGTVRYIVHRVEDVTSRVCQGLAAEAAWEIVENEHARAEVILETMGDAHYTMDRNFRILTANAAMERALGGNRAQWIGRTQWEAFPASVGSISETNLRRVASERVPRHWSMHYTDDLHDLDVDVSAYPTVEGGVALFWRDVTERERANASLRASEARYRSLFESLDEGFCVIEVLFDEAGRAVDYCFVEINEAFVAQTGLSDAVGKRIRDLAPGHEQHWFDIYGKVATTGEPVRFDAPAQALGRYYTVYAFRIGEPDEHNVAILFTDVAAQKEAERERERLLAAAESERARAEAANLAKSEFLAVMSHELRTPLNAIDGYAELMELGIRGPLTESQREDLARIRKSQRHLLGLINGVLNYAKLDAGMLHYDIEDVSLEEVLSTCEALVAPQAKTRGITLDSSGCDPSLVALGDREKVQQIVLNLLSNALKFTSSGGRVSLGCAAVSDGGVAVWVKDTGRGIDVNQHERVFQPFVQVDSGLTRTQEGVGLGLAISRDLARGMGGDLVVESTPGVGSLFTLTLNRRSA